MRRYQEIYPETGFRNRPRHNEILRDMGSVRHSRILRHFPLWLALSLGLLCGGWCSAGMARAAGEEPSLSLEISAIERYDIEEGRTLEGDVTSASPGDVVAVTLSLRNDSDARYTFHSLTTYLQFNGSFLTFYKDPESEDPGSQNGYLNAGLLGMRVVNAHHEVVTDSSGGEQSIDMVIVTTTDTDGRSVRAHAAHTLLKILFQVREDAPDGMADFSFRQQGVTHQLAHTEIDKETKKPENVVDPVAYSSTAALYVAGGSRQLVQVSFDPGGGTGIMTPRTAEEDGFFSFPECGFTAPAGQRFRGWLCGGKEYRSGASVTLTEDTVLTALWEEAVPEAAMPYVISDLTLSGGSGSGSAGGALTARIANNSGTGGLLLVSVYDSAGRFLRCETETLDTSRIARGSSDLVTVSVNLTGGASVRVFAADPDTCQPLSLKQAADCSAI